MMTINTLKDAFLDSLNDLHSAEQQLLKALPAMERKASSEELKAIIRAHFDETEEHVMRLKKIESMMKAKLTDHTCRAMLGLVEEEKSVISRESSNGALIDTLLIGVMSRVEHYEMAAYESALIMAEELGEDSVAKILNEILKEEFDTKEKLHSLYRDEILPDANVAEDDDYDTDNDKVLKKNTTLNNGSHTRIGKF